MPIISNTMLEAPIPININVNNIFDEYDENFKPRRKESKFLKYLLTSNRLQFTNNTTDEIDNVSNNNTTTITNNNNIKNTMTSDNVSIQQQPTTIESTQQQQQQQELSELNKKRRKRIIENESELTIADIDDSFEVNQEVDSDENERATTPEPLARKEIKRRKTIDFLFQDVPYSYHPQPYSYVYPHIAPQQNTKNTWLPIMRSMSMSTLPIPTTNSSSSSVGSSATTSPSLSPINSRKKKIMSTSYPLIPISERQQEQQLLALSTPITPLTTPRKTPSRMLQQMKRESEEAEITSNNSNNNNSNTSFDGDMKLSELAESFQSPVAAPPPVPRRKMSETGLEGDMTPQGQNDTNFAERIIECLKSIGGKATGAEITQWISSNYDDVLSTKKKLGYTVNAVLSSKKHQNVFAKESVIIDGNKRAMWKLIDELADKSKLPNNNNNNTITPSTTTNSANISSHKLDKKSRSKLDLYDENDIPDESSTDPYGPEHLSDDEIDKDEDWIDEGSARRKKLLQSMSPSAYDLQRYINFEKTTGDLSLNSEIKEDQEMSLKTSKVLEEQGSQMVNVLETTIETTEMHPTIKEQNLPFLSAINMGDQSVTQNSEINTDDLLSNEESVLDTGKFNEISNEIVVTSSVTKKGRPPLSRRRKAGSFHDEASNEAWTPSDLKDDEMDMKDIEEDDDEEEEIYNKYNNNNSKITNNNNNIINNNNNITSESSGESSGSDVEDSKDSMLDKEIKVSEDEHNDELKIEEEKKPITTTTKRGVGRPRGTTSGSTPRARVSKRAKGDEEIFDFDDNDLEEFEYDEKLLSKSKRQENNDEEDGKKSRRKSKGKRSRKGRKKREEGEDLQGESETDQKYDEPDELEGSTYTEMIIHALRALGGRGTGTEITTFIDENYSDILQTKTSTWKNSVMGCLSANRRNVFSKEPVKEYAKRYVWVLNEAKNTHQGPESDKKIKRKKKEKSDDVMNSSSDSLKDGVTQNDWVEPIVLPEKPVVNEESKDYDMDLEAIFEDDFENEDLDDGSEDDYDGSNKKHQNTNIAPTFNSVRKGRCDNAVELITEALRDMGGSATGIQITEWLAVHYKDLADDRKKLGYTVNAVLSSKKYRGRFVKEKMVQGGGSARALWRLGAPSGGRNKGRTSH